MISRTYVRILTGVNMKEIEDIGFIFTETEIIYLNDNLGLDINMLYKSRGQGDTNNIPDKEDDISG